MFEKLNKPKIRVYQKRTKIYAKEWDKLFITHLFDKNNLHDYFLWLMGFVVAAAVVAFQIFLLKYHACIKMYKPSCITGQITTEFTYPCNYYSDWEIHMTSTSEALFIFPLQQHPPCQQKEIHILIYNIIE